MCESDSLSQRFLSLIEQEEESIAKIRKERVSIKDNPRLAEVDALLQQTPSDAIAHAELRVLRELRFRIIPLVMITLNSS